MWVWVYCVKLCARGLYGAIYIGVMIANTPFLSQNWIDTWRKCSQSAANLVVICCHVKYS